MITKLFRLILLMQLVLPIASYAQSEAVSNGLDWLKANQVADGSWSSTQSSSTDYYTTVSVLDSLAAIGETTSTAYTNGLTWTRNALVEGTTYIAPRVRVMAASGADAITDLNTLLFYYNAGYGWGGDTGHSPTIFHTALALQALKAGSYSDPTVIYSSLAYLTTNQNSDGGWGFAQGDESNIYMTAVVSATLQQFPQVSTISTAVNKASGYLTSHQNADGGFGASESTPYETALAFSALVAISSNSPAFTSAINYLTSTQSADGSWQEDPYSTALALKALYFFENRPSPPPPPPAGGTITGIVVDAVTKARVPGVGITLAGNSLINTTSDSSGTFTLSDVPPGAQSVGFSLTGYAAKTVSTDVVVDGAINLGNVALLSSYSTGFIAGTITDSTGKPVADASVTVSGAWSGSAATGPDGSYSFSYVIPGDVTITAAKTGYLPVTGSGTVFARTKLSFSPRLNTAATQGTTGTIVGRIVDDYWGVPIGHLGGEKGVQVAVSGRTPLDVEPEGGGYFTIADLQPGTYQVVVGMNGFKTRTFRAVVMPGVTTDLGTIILEMTILEMALTGRVIDATTGVPIPGAEVTITEKNFTGRSDFAGTYAITDIPTGVEYTVKVFADGYVGKTYRISSSPWTQTMDFALAPRETNGSLTGTVIDAATSQPIAGVTLTLVADPVISSTTDSNGVFSFAAVPKGVQQVALSLSGYAGRTLTTAVSAGVLNNTGNIPLSVTPLHASVQGRVWDGYAKAPFPGVQILMDGASTRQTSTAADGSYTLEDVEPGKVTLTATAVTMNGYYPASFTGFLEPNGIVVFSPTLTTAPPTVVEVTALTDKTSYTKSEPVNLAVTLLNTEGVELTSALRVRVRDSVGTAVFETTADLNLPAGGTQVQDFTFTLPLSAPGGAYKVLADLYDTNGTLLGTATKGFGVATSRIAVIPSLPAAFATGANPVTFSLTNSGDIAVSSGVITVTLKDPEGQVVASATENFTLKVGESTTVSPAISIPSLRFGTYILSYSESDETITGTPIEISIANSIAITALFDDNSHRVRQTAGLTVTLTDTGRFNLDPNGAGLPVTVSVPDAAYTETKTLVPAPAVGSAVGSSLLYRFALPETLPAGLHQATVTVTLPSGSVFVRNAQLAIQESALSLAPLQEAFSAGNSITPVFANDGGVDTQVQYHLSLRDSGGALLAEKIATETVPAGSSIAAGLAIPDGAVDGAYSLLIAYQDQKTGKEGMVTKLLTIVGVKGTLQARTDKQAYLLTENINALTTIANSGTPLQSGNLHLQVTTGTGAEWTKTWTTQADFQSGTRSGVDTYGVNDWIIPNDDFSGTSIDTNKWMKSGNVTIKSNSLYLDTTQTTGGAVARSTWLLEGDFDIQVDFDANNSSDWVGAQLAVGVENSWMSIGNYKAPGYGSQISINNVQMAYVTGGSSVISGRFRVTRSGSTMSSYFWGGTSWIALSTYTAQEFTGAASVALNIYRTTGLSGATTQFDNFKVTAGRIKTVNQTVDSVRLMPLSDNFDRGSLNTDRWSTWTNNGTVSVLNGAIQLKNPDGVASGQYADAGHRGAWVEGDFDVQVDFNMESSPTSGYLYALRAHFIGGEGIQTAYHWLYNNSYNAVYRDPTGQYDIALGSSPTTDKTGRLRLKRVGSTITWFYWNNTLNRWEWNGNTAGISMTAPTSPVFLVLEGGKYLSNTVGNSVRFDNLFVSQKYVKTGKLSLKYDSGRSGAWNKLSYTADTPSGTSVKFRTRTAETSAGLADAVWSDYFTGNDSIIPSPAGRCIEVEATLATTDPNVTPILRDVTVTQGLPPGGVLWQADVPANLAQGMVADQNKAIGTLGLTGKFYLQGALTSGTGQTVASAEYPFYVEQGNILLLLAPDKKVYRPGETVTVVGEVKNQGTVDASGLNLTLASKPAGGVAQVFANEPFTLAAGASYPFTASLIAGADGVVGLTGTVTQNGVTLADMADQYEIASPMVTATLTVPDTADNVPFAMDLALVNGGKTDASVTVSTSFGSATETVVVPAGRTVYRQYQEQITADATYTVTLTGDTDLTLTKSVVFVVPPPIVTAAGINAKVVTDKISYSANERAVVTSFITAGTAVENLSALVTITNDRGQGIYTAMKPLAMISQGQTVTFSNYWDIGTATPGAYQVGLQVIDGAGTVMTKATCNLTVIISASPKALLKGQLTLDKQSLLTGEPVAVSYSITNVGNTDLSGVAMSVRTINLADQLVYGVITDQTALATGGSHGNSGRIDTQGFSARDYLVILSATIGGVEETLAGSYFRVEGAPSTPAISAPSVGSDVVTLTPSLTVSNAADPNEDKLIYEYEVYSDPGLANMVVSGTVAEAAGSTSWGVPMALAENETYFWRSRAYDGKLYGSWMAPAYFRVNTANDPPTAPAISSPANGKDISVVAPTLTVTNAADPDSVELTYNFDLALDPSFSQIVASERGVSAGAGTTSWAAPISLQENTWYFWRAQADDWLEEGPWSTTGRFFVNTTNEAPAAPVITAPANASTVAALAVDFQVSNSSDPDSAGLTYFFETDTVDSFDSPNIFRSGAVAEGQGTTAWQIAGLQENTRYYVRVKASDGSAESPWSQVTTFFASTLNDPPTVPTLANPSSGSGVNLSVPTLSVHNATDPDLDPLTYEFELYADASMTELIAASEPVAETPQRTGWTVPVSLEENQTCYWRCRAFDGYLHSGWMPTASFMVNTVNDAPGAPVVRTPVTGSSVPTLTPVLSVDNAIDPDSDSLIYEFEIYTGGTLVASTAGIPGGVTGTTSWTTTTPLSDDTDYQWRARAFDGERYGVWSDMATFTTHLPVTSITATIDIDPETLNKASNGTWITVYIELPPGHRPADIDIASLRVEGTVLAELRPYAIGDHDKDGITELMVKFRRGDVIGLLPTGDKVPVHVSGKVGEVTFEGVDVIRVIK